MNTQNTLKLSPGRR